MKTLYLALLLVIVALVAQSRPVPLAIGAHCVGALHAQEGYNPQPGNPGHPEPPPGWSCSTGGEGAHGCACHPECVSDGMGGTFYVEDHGNCKVSCFKDHCACVAKGCE